MLWQRWGRCTGGFPLTMPGAGAGARAGAGEAGKEGPKGGVRRPPRAKEEVEGAVRRGWNFNLE